jgi:hypothetical protein
VHISEHSVHIILHVLKLESIPSAVGRHWTNRCVTHSGIANPE